MNAERLSGQSIPAIPSHHKAEFHREQLRDSLDHVRSTMGLQDIINSYALEVLMDAVTHTRLRIKDPKTSELVAEAREWAKYDATGAAKIVLELCDALEDLNE